MTRFAHGGDPRGRLVRPYAITRGRTEPTSDIALETVLVTTVKGREEARFTGRDKQWIAGLCDSRPLSLAEIASYTQAPLGVARVLVAEMAREGLLAIHDAGSVRQDRGEWMELLEEVLHGLRRI